jgi:diguanylate cyclase
MAGPEEDRYRKKYLDLLDEIDTKEKQWEEIDGKLRRILTHLLIVAERPGSREVSAELAELRESLKQEATLEAVEQQIEALKDKILNEPRPDESFEGFPPVHLILIHLVERLPLPPEMTEGALEVVESLEEGISPDRLPGAIEAVTNLVYQVRASMQDEKHELEELLKEITGKLTDLDKGLTAAHREAQAGFASNRSLEAAVDDEVRGLEATTREAGDLEALRNEVLAKIESIRGRVEVKRKEDEDREARLRSEVEGLQRTIANLEEEVTEYREKTRQAREMSLRDPLTGCYNRLAYQERARAEEARWLRYRSPLSLIVFDLDRFKAINDSFGHRAGDQVLKTIAQIAGNQLREVDFFARYGGEEFVAILPETPREAALTVAEKVRRAVEAFRFHSRGKRVPLTLSCGVAQLADGDGIDAAFERADQAMYRAKSAGRNRSVTEAELAADG